MTDKLSAPKNQLPLVFGVPRGAGTRKLAAGVAETGQRMLEAPWPVKSKVARVGLLKATRLSKNSQIEMLFLARVESFSRAYL